MKFKFLFPFVLAVVIGYLFGKFMFNQYDSKASIKSVFSEQENQVYFIQQGVYSSKESMDKNVLNLSSYIYDEIDGKYYVYIAITKNENNLSKLKGYFENLGYVIYVKQFSVNNQPFLEKLLQYDELLLNTSDNGAIKEIINQTLKSYEELINVNEP